MNIRTPMTLLTLVATCLGAGDDAVVRFSNGDQLTGEVLALSGDRLTWKSQILSEPSEFDLRHIVDLTMPAGNTAEGDSGAAHKALLEMTNGDLIQGRLAGLDDEGIRLKTSFAGELMIRRVNVSSVSISRSSDYIYRGPNSLEEWTLSGAGSWQFRGGALHAKSPGGIAREVDFPEECVIAFDAAWRGAFRPKIIFFSNDVTSQNPDAGYEMVFQGNSVHVKKSGSNNWLGHSTNAGVLRENEKARIEIRASRKSGKILLYVDGEVVDLWEDADVAAGDFGKGFHLVSQDGSMLRISNIGIGQWDGYHDEVPNRQAGIGGRAFPGRFDFGVGDEEIAEDETEEEQAEGRMVLVNGDSIEGEVVKVEGDDITLKTPFAEVTFPIVRLRNIALRKADMETVKLYKGDVRATFGDGSRLVFRFDGVDGDKIVGFSQHFGEAHFSKDAFSRIEFNIYDKKMEAMRLSDEW